MKPKTWDLKSPSAFLLAPELEAVQGLMPTSEADLHALKADIEAHDIRDPLKCYYGEDGRTYVLAGATRLKIAQELKLPLIPFEIVEVKEKDREAFAITENLARRHLNTEQRIALVRYFAEKFPKASSRYIASLAKVDHKTVEKHRPKSGGEFPHPDEQRIGKDGKKQAARKAPRSRAEAAEARQRELDRQAEAAKRPKTAMQIRTAETKYLLTLEQILIKLPAAPPREFTERGLESAKKRVARIVSKLAPFGAQFKG